MLQGKGIFIWQVQKCEQGQTDRLVALVRSAQLSHVIFKLSDGTYDFPVPAEDPGGTYELMTDAAIRALQNAGVQVWALSHTQGKYPAMEAHRAASRVLKWGLAGLVINPQSQYQGQPGKARLFMETLRADLGPDIPIAFNLFRGLDELDAASLPVERRFPVDVFAESSDLLMPQVYWIARDGGDPAAALRESHSQYARRYPDKPYIPTGAAFGEQYGSLQWSATPQQIELFLNQVRALGLDGANFWSWQHACHDARSPYYTETQLWDAVATYPWAVAGLEPGGSASGGGGEDEVEEIVAPGDPRYIDGLYGRFNTIRFLTMPGQYGPVKYALTHPTRSTLWAQWVPGVAHDGRYEVAAWIPSTHATAKHVRYHIRGVVGQDSTVVVELDQSRYFDEFVRLGVFELDGDRPDAGAVSLTNLTGESQQEIAFGPLRWTYLGEVASVRLADGYDAPVGTVEERASGELWPGHWLDAVGYRTNYVDGVNTRAYHTGADLNLNVPHWDADRGEPVWAIASGTVVGVERLANWGMVVIIRHDPVDQDGNAVWARYAHVADVAVRVNEVVQRGQQIAVIGKPEAPDAPFHLHFDICVSGILAQDPGHWPRLDYQALLEHYIDPRAFIRDHRPQQ